ncbi:AI-2E family transporter, partial [Elusimicrobiota bacterium]
MLDDRPYTFDRVFRLAVTVGILYGVVRLMAYLSDVLIPFTVAFLLAYLLNPVVVWVQEKVRNRVAAVFLTLSGVAVVVALLGVIFVPAVMREVGHMGSLVKRVVEDTELARRAAEKLPPDLWETIRQYAGEERMRDLLQHKDVWSLGTAVARRVLPGVWGLVAGTTNLLLGVIGLFVIGLYLVFMLMDYQRLKDEWKRLIPPSWRDPVLDFIREFDAAMSRHFRAQAVVAAIVGMLFSIGFSLIGLPMGLLFGLFVGLLNMVPYLQMVAVVPATLLAVVMALETGGNIWVAVGLTGLIFVVVQALQDAVIT